MQQILAVIRREDAADLHFFLHAVFHQETFASDQ